MSVPLAEIRGLSVSYGCDDAQSFALQGVDLDIAKGRRLAVIGESGSGKSTLALALAELLPPQARIEGTVGWSGLAHAPVAGRDIGMVFQDPGGSLNPVLTIGEQVAEGAVRHLGLGWRAARSHALALLERVRIPDPQAALRAFPHQFSGGQRQRIAIAAAIAAKPGLLIADEPTSALDMVVQAEIVVLLDTLVREAGMTLVFITHDIALASGLADDIAVFQRARLVEKGSAQAVLTKPAHAYTKHLLAAQIDFSTPRLIDGVGDA
ncbi:peptide/nickel transport system ATP-binding protein [Nitratireductor aquibiodomus]|uniref:Peptide/nickel transport system ATP-binding protein n=1 Tax=Nitratireductor aquibiodomus TaxID=204799 RepID=A0A1H4JNR4_9HYPH|nr:ABC transporter ATP-binding protein [Nitratireductor aquibiodomus]SEB47807.1 peptide/nickel transport system ATP-binding protein [Nitratireductor aquibiodomus]